MMYARGVDIKRGINEQFKDVYPHITITLSKIRRLELSHDLSIVMFGFLIISIKREMKKIAETVRFH